MTPETVHLIERLYPEIRDDLLVALVGGVVNEPILFDDKVDFYPLAQPAQGVRSITGTATLEAGQPPQRFFQRDIDFEYSSGDNAIIWLEGGTWPDDDSVFYVDYFAEGSRSPLTDINVGSVGRTICEAIGREMAVVYQQVNETYRSGFIDTAQGRSLDLVVSILGITRKTKDFAVGQVTFFRDPAVDGGISIPIGTLLTTAKGEATFVTTQLRTLQRGQVRIDVPVRAGDASRGEVGLVAADSITVLVQPIAGISRVNNFEPLALAAEDETDEDLRSRAKAALRGLGKGTLAALIQVIAEQRAKLTEVWEPNGPPARQTPPGIVSLLVESEPERFPSLQAAVAQTRAAGVQTSLVARYIFFKPRLTVSLIGDLSDSNKAKVRNDVIDAIRQAVEALGSGEAIAASAVLEAIATVKEVATNETGQPIVRFLDVMTWQADVGQPSTADLTDALVTAMQSVPPTDLAAQKAAIDQVLLAEGPSLVPTGQRLPNRSLIQTLDGNPAQDGDIEAAEFQVIAEIDGQPWWIVLDLDPTDVLLA
ncbi:hypothetical protein PN498_13985 [Oscillatoria sp. CS-180]|uniref:baseplate J/gp47 family protein n=1 Tax=Oscillatoria sp. CS-180 TaxID=3021720 RepID=UPI00232F6039|nr:baseplate J/gp47 family protein [Oscillatoria sp. CS-180]MDB9527107.1 hypothetical protein [Oscillatoria sp. CS-180]